MATVDREFSLTQPQVEKAEALEAAQNNLTPKLEIMQQVMEVVEVVAASAPLAE